MLKVNRYGGIAQLLSLIHIFFMTETAAYADVVLPAAAYAEQLGTYTNTERRVQLSYPAVPPPGEARADWEILTGLANRFGLDWSYSGAEDVFNDEVFVFTPKGDVIDLPVGSTPLDFAYRILSLIHI